MPNIIGALASETKGLLKGHKDFEIRGGVYPSKLQYY